MSSYSRYKPADIRWIEKVPEHWRVKPLFAVMRELKQLNRGNQEDNVLSLSYGRIIRRDLSQNFGLLPESFETYQLVSPGNIVLRLTDLQNDKKSLRVGLVEENGIITSAYISLASSSEIIPKFAYYLLHAYDLMKVFYNEGAGVRQSMTFRDLRRMPVLIPSLLEQRAIVGFLDRKTSQIDTLITKKQRQIELFFEQRTAIINQAVTKGLFISAPLKESGVNWLGKIPPTWGLTQVKYVAENLDSKRIPVRADERGNKQGNFPYYGANGIIDYIDDYIFEGEYLLVGEDGAPFFLKEDVAFIVDGKFWVNNHAHVLKIKNDFDIRFIKHALNCVDYAGYISGSTRDKLPQSDLARITIPFPSVQEQKTIADFLDRKTTQIESLIAATQKVVDFLHEYRTSLISEAVTGKIDVRAEA